MKEKNYTIHYDTSGAVSFVDVYGGASPASPGKMQTPQTKPLIQRAITTPPPQTVQPATAAPSGAAQPVRRPPVPVTTFRRPAVPAAPPAPQPEQPAAEAGTTYNDTGPEEDVSEIPYIQPQSKPVYIPPRTK